LTRAGDGVAKGTGLKEEDGKTGRGKESPRRRRGKGEEDLETKLPEAADRETSRRREKRPPFGGCKKGKKTEQDGAPGKKKRSQKTRRIADLGDSGKGDPLLQKEREGPTRNGIHRGETRRDLRKTTGPLQKTGRIKKEKNTTYTFYV